MLLFFLTVYPADVSIPVHRDPFCSFLQLNGIALCEYVIITYLVRRPLSMAFGLFATFHHYIPCWGDNCTNMASYLYVPLCTLPGAALQALFLEITIRFSHAHKFHDFSQITINM